MIEPTTLSLTGDRVGAVYEFYGDVTEAEARVDSLRVEQTIEFPADLVPDDDIQREIVGRVESVDVVDSGLVRAAVSYAIETTGYELPQLLNVLWGNSALLPGIRLVDFSFPNSLLARFGGPRFGVTGLRNMFDASHRPLLATAIKPMGLSPKRFAEMVYQLALGGMDMIKDDHSLANQPFAPYVERVNRCAEAVARANAESGGNAVYMPSINAPFHLLEQRVQAAVDAGAGGLLILPGITSLDHMRHVASRDDVALPIMGHPAFFGSYTASPENGIAHGRLYGTLMRLAGADLSVFPTYGGRFSFTQDECRAVVGGLSEPLGDLAAAMPSPGGGMTLDRVKEIREFYGNDVALLIGGDLHRGDNLTKAAASFRAAVEA